MSKKSFHVAIDFPDDVRNLGRCFEPEEVRQLFECFAEIGIERVYWMYYGDDFIYRPITTGDNHIRLACRLAHELGLKIYMVIKPFETGVAAHGIPSTWKWFKPDDGVTGLMGNYPWVTDFVRAHREMCIQHRDAFAKPNTMPVTSIKLLKKDAAPTAVTGSDLKLYTSSFNGGFQPYPGTYECTESVEKRDGQKVRVLTLTGVNIPAREKYVLIECTRRSKHPTFENRADRMLELYDARGQVITATWNEKQPRSRDDMAKLVRGLRAHRYGIHGDATIPDDYGRDLPSSSFSFDLGHSEFARFLDGPPDDVGSGHIAVVRGRNAYHIGALHPCYPEVREYWLDMVRESIEAGADGVDFRINNHSSWCSNPLEYGFNPPVVEEYRKRYNVDILTESFDVELWKKLQGEYFTQFLEDSNQLLHAHGRNMQIHVDPTLEEKQAQHPGCIGSGNNVPGNFEFPWKTWLRNGLADEVSLKSLLRHPSLPESVEFGRRVCALAKELGLPVFLIGNISGNDGNPYWDLSTDFIRRWLAEPAVVGCILYECATITSFNKNSGRMEGSNAIRRFLAEFN